MKMDYEEPVLVKTHQAVPRLMALVKWYTQLWQRVALISRLRQLVNYFRQKVL